MPSKKPINYVYIIVAFYLFLIPFLAYFSDGLVVAINNFFIMLSVVLMFEILSCWRRRRKNAAKTR
jgi:hypothetical protein